MSQPIITAIIFDMDGLMFDSERLTLDAWRRAMADHGYQASEQLFVDAVGLTMDKTNEVLRAYYGPKFPLEATNRRTGEYFREAVALHGAPLKPGLLPLLDYLRDSGLRLAVASSSSRRGVDHMLNAAGLMERFSATVAGDEVEHGKPAPDIFLRAGRSAELRSRQLPRVGRLGGRHTGRGCGRHSLYHRARPEAARARGGSAGRSGATRSAWRVRDWLAAQPGAMP